jgi:hypothetical protein
MSNLLGKVQPGAPCDHTSIKDFEYTPECVIFDLLDIDIVHGWLIHPKDENYNLIAPLSYNQVCPTKEGTEFL